MFDIHPNPWKEGDRVRVKHGPHAGRTGTVEGGGGLALGTPNDYNTRVNLDDSEHGDARPILNDRALEAE